MKRLILIACMLQIIVPGAFAASAKEEARIVALVTKAFKNKDATVLSDLYCWEGVTKEEHDETLKRDKELVKSGQVEKVSIIKATKEDNEGYVHNSVKYGPNLKIISNVEIKMITTKKDESTWSFPLGEKSGKLYIVLPKRVK
ncbi:hypothetical protein KI809_13935 [Geobacter pelophilus]|uniref:Uncharacterized protein n=1 Tax=Geoanaerobacter pelophilus TaxID=60036 RepID=A0AAW4L384_9BACT|nr:hypothetical protein [Geoanaerobacter pelophilus]MBT0665403.1 hypothetical protein [Geoanaerobacter pelophilus]